MVKPFHQVPPSVAAATATPEVVLSRTLSVPRPKVTRSKTPDFSQPPDHAVRAIFERSVYADPKPAKASIMDLGKALHTPGHVRLVGALRDECARLHGYADHLKERLHEAQMHARKAERHGVDVRAELGVADGKIRQLAMINGKLADELRLATEALNEMDGMVLSIQSKRLSRMGDAAPSAQAKATLAQAGRMPSAQTFGADDSDSDLP